ncbi:MAG: hypothetical protein AAB781_00220 [Patescibacteria group bacterium]
MIFNFLKKKFAILLIISIWIMPANSFAFSLGAGGMVPGLPFGGLVIVTLPCTCSANLWIWFTPLYPLPLPTAGPLVYQPGYTTLYGDFAIGVPATWHLGSYTPGIQTCWQYVGITCAPMVNYGLMNKVGTGLP